MSLDDHKSDQELEAEYKASQDRLKRVGGPAFPVGFTCTHAGMTLRDYFAARALPAVITAAVQNGHTDQESIVAEAYELADAMLEARKRGQDGQAANK